MTEVSFAPTSAELATVLMRMHAQAPRPLTAICRTSAIQTMVGHQLAQSDSYHVYDEAPIRLTTFEAWLRDQWILIGDGRQLIDATGRRIYLQRILEDSEGSLSPILTTPAGRSMLEGVCKNHHLGKKRPLPRTHIVHAIRAIAEHYDEIITAEGLIDIGGAIRILCTKAEQIDQDLVLLGFSDLTHAQQSVFEAIAPHHTLSILGSGAPDSLMRAALIEMAEGLGAPVKLVPDDPEITSHQTRTLAEVARQMYRPKQQVTDPDESAVSFHVASGEAAQVATIIAELQRLRSTDDINRIAVVMPSLRAHLPHLVRELERHRIPYQFDTEIALTATELGNAFLALAALLSGDTDAGTVARFTESRYSGWSPVDAIRLDRVLRSSDPNDCIDLTSFVESSLSQYLTRGQTTTSSRAERILELACTCKGGASLDVWQEVIDLMLSAGLSQGAVTSYQHAVLLASYRTIGTALFELSKVKHDRITSSALATALEGCIVQLNPLFGSRDVILTTPERIDGLAFDALIVAGTDSSAATATTSLSGTQQVLHLMGMDRHSEKSEQAIEDSLSLRNRFFEVSVVATPQKHLSIIFQHADEKGAELQPSAFLEEVVAQFQKPEVGFKKTLKDLVTPNEELKWDSQEVNEALCLGIAGEVAHEVPVLGRGERCIKPHNPDSPLSVSNVEAYAQCPYEWFLGRRIDRFEFDRTFDARESGDLVHAVLKETFIRWRDSGNEPVTAENVGALHHLADEALAECEAKRARPLKETNPDEYLRIHRYLHIAIDSEPWFSRKLDYTMRPLAFELRLPEADPICVEGLALSGTIDRVDVSDEGFIVIDYKSRGSGAETPVINQRKIQAPLYLLALEQWANREQTDAPRELIGKQPVGFLYRVYKEQKKALAVIDQSVVTWADNDKTPNPAEHDKKHDTYLASMARIQELITDAIDGILHGAIAPRPLEKGWEHTCSYCPAVRCPMRKESYQ